MDDLPVRVYTQESALRNPVRLVREIWRGVRSGRELAWQLALRDLREQYRQAALGLVWAFILPLANSAAWLVIHGTGVVTIRETSLPYPAYVISGTILWAIFMEALNAPLRQTSSARSMLSKINFPREALVMSGVYKTIFNAGIKTLVLLIALLFLGIRPDAGLAFYPLAVLALIVTGTALGLLITPIGMLYSDVGKGLPLLLQFFMFLTPVVFPMPTAGWARTIFELNPLTPLILTSRALVSGQRPEDLAQFLMVSLIMLVLLAIALVIYRAAMPILIERMSI